MAFGITFLLISLFFQQGLYSEIGDTEIFEVQPDAFSAMNVSSSGGGVWFFIFSLLMLAGVGCGVIFFLQKNRRNHTTFSRFSNPHYDPKTGSTRIGDALEDDDHHQEVPSRFDDDAPLVT